MNTDNQVNKVDTLDYSQELETFTTKSSKIRYLNGKGLSRSQISKVLGIRYQHVRNVLITPLKKGE